MFEKFKLPFSYRTLLFALALIISSVFMRQVLNLFLRFSSRRHLAYGIAIAMAIAACIIIYLLVREKAWYRLLVMLAMLVALGVLSKIIPLPEERFHLIEFF